MRSVIRCELLLLVLLLLVDRFMLSAVGGLSLLCVVCYLLLFVFCDLCLVVFGVFVSCVLRVVVFLVDVFYLLMVSTIRSC